jgi:Flp pilus assembly protein TadD
MRKKGDFQGAIAEYSEAIRIEPDYLHAWMGRGATYIEVHQYEKGDCRFHKGLRAAAQQPNAVEGPGCGIRRVGPVAHGLPLR